jgi:RHS repeat-associated protein
MRNQFRCAPPWTLRACASIEAFTRATSSLALSALGLLAWSPPALAFPPVPFGKLTWQPASDAEKLGFAFMYDEEGTLIAQTGTGGANSTGSTQYIYLPTPNGPMPIAAVINGEIHAVHSDHLNTPRRLTNSQGQPVWQWAYSAFGDNEPTIAKNRFADLSVMPNPGTTNFSAIEFNLGYPGMYRDKESNLFYNYFRSYHSPSGRYTQFDPIGLAGGWNGFNYGNGNPLMFIDPLGLDTWGNDPSLKDIGTSNGQACSWLSRAQGSGSDPYQYLFDARNIDGLDRHDPNLVAAERYMGGYSGEFSDTLILGQHFLKQARALPGATNILGRNGSPASSSAFVAKWGMLGNLHRQQGAGLEGSRCGCKQGR